MIQRYYDSSLDEDYIPSLPAVMGCDDGNVVLYADHLAEMQRVEAENKVSTALNIADAETIERMLAENASLKEALTKIWEVASGESQVAMDDTAGMEWISDYASSLWDDDGKFAARAGGK